MIVLAWKWACIFTHVQQEWNQSASDLFTFGSRFNDIVQKVMASFNFIPVEEVGLRKFKFIQIVLQRKKRKANQ